MSERRILRSSLPRHSAGLTLVELLVGLALGLFLLGGVLSIFTNTRQSFRVNENMARVQENARFSFEVLMREIREAGSIPCGSKRVANVVALPASMPWWANWDGGTVIGYDGAQASPAKGFGTAAADRIAATDAITVLRTVSDEASFTPISAHDVAGNTFTVGSAAGLSAGDVVVVCDAEAAALLKISAPVGTSIPYGGGGNCSTKLGYPTSACDGTQPDENFNLSPLLAKLDPVFWYIGSNGSGGRSLYRMHLTKAGGAPSPEAQEMVPGVTDMQIEYLTRGAALATDWIAADNATLTGAGTWTLANANQVVAVRVTLTVQSDEKVGTDGNALQRKFVAVASLRGRESP